MINTLEIVEKEGQHYAKLRCQWCPTQIEVPVDLKKIDAWRKGQLIQNAMPDLSKDLREMFISGTCPKCWDEMFPPEE
jgi:hypothetical protein